MADQAELVFVRSFVKAIGAQPIMYSDDYNQPPQNSLKKVPILPVRVRLEDRVSWHVLKRNLSQVELPPVPERIRESSTPPGTCDLHVITDGHLIRGH